MRAEEATHFGAEYRHQYRINKWRRAERFFPKLRHDAWWFLHNVVSHPLLGLWPSKEAIWLHDYTSQKLNRRASLRPSPTPKIPDFYLWAKHNILGHVAIGLFPTRRAFDWHDKTAEEMKVPGWV